MVTGASDGIGKEAALTYARHGAKLILLGRSESKLKQVQQTIAAEGGKPATVFPYDLLTAQPKHYAMLQEELMKEVDRLTVCFTVQDCLERSLPLSSRMQKRGSRLCRLT